MEMLKKIFRKAAKIFKWLLIVASILFLALVLIGVIFDEEELLKDAFVAPDISLKSAMVKYVTKEGVEVSVPAYAGQIEILTSIETNPGKVTEFVSGRGGKIIAQAPSVGIYIAEVSGGEEAKLIDVLLKESWVADAYPYTPLEKNQAEYIFDFWEEPSRERSHGAAVCYYAIGQKECTKEILDSCFEHKNCQESEWPMFYQIVREIKAKEDAPFITINLSLGPIAKDKNGKQLPITATQTLYKSYFGMLIQILGRDDVASVKKTIIINSAGNEGVDLTPVFQSLSSRKGFERLLLVGAVTQAGKISSYSNYSKGERDIMYSVGGEKAIPMAGKHVLWTGTSFSAPQITCLLNNWLRKSPERAAHPEELRGSLFDADAGKDTKRDFQYRYRIDPCLTEKPAEDLKEEPKKEMPPSPSRSTPDAKVTPTKIFNFSVPERLPSGKVGFSYSNSFNYALDELLKKYGGGGGCSGESCGGLDLTVHLSGGKPPYRFSVVGKLPDGIRLDSSIGYLTGFPTSEGEYHFQICATDNLGVKTCKDTSLIVEAADAAITYTNKAWEKWGTCMTKELGLERFAQLLNDPDSQTREETDTFLACFADFTFEELYNKIFTSSQRACVVQEIGNARVQAFLADPNLVPTDEEGLKVFQCGDLISVSPVTETPPPPAPTPISTPPPSQFVPETGDIVISSWRCLPLVKLYSFQGTYAGEREFQYEVNGTAQGPVNAEVHIQGGGSGRGVSLTCAQWTHPGDNWSYACARAAGDPDMTTWSYTSPKNIMGMGDDRTSVALDITASLFRLDSQTVQVQCPTPK